MCIPHFQREGGQKMKNSERVISILLVALLVASAFVAVPGRADDQAKDLVTALANPSGVTFNDVAWNEDTYAYAIAVGNTTTNGVVYKYDATNGWTLLITKTSEKYYDVVYDTFAHNGTFYFVGEESITNTAVAYTLNPDFSAPQITISGISPSVFYGAYFDSLNGNSGTLLAVGKDTMSNGTMAYYDIYGATWTANQTNSGDVLEAVTVDPYYNFVYAVGHNGASALAYKYTWSGSPQPLVVPSNAGAFYGIDWQTMGEITYGLVVGTNTSNSGFVWKIFNDDSFSEVAGVTSGSPALRDVDWNEDGTMAVIVGDGGTLYVYYDINAGRVVDWSTPSFTSDTYGVAVKSPGSPGYGLGVGVSSAPKISYQVADSSTQIEVNTIYPHLNEIDLRTAANVSVLNQQVDTGTVYHYYINGSYALGWENVNIDIYGWYDEGVETTLYNATAGGNLNFHLRYQPDPSYPYQKPGNWTLLWPVDYHEITMGAVGTIEWDDNPNNGTVGVRDGEDFYHVNIDITFGPQVRYAAGEGTWDAATDRTTTSGAFNDAGSWNTQVTLSDSGTGASQTQYDEFGVYAYTEVSAINNPTGSGPPGSTIVLSPNSEVFVSSNLNYSVTANVTDLTSTSGKSISKSYIYLQNMHADAAGNSDVSTMTNFTAGGGALWVWGVSGTSTYMPPLNFGRYSAGPNNYGNTTADAHTLIAWEVEVIGGTPEDHFTATITYTVTYP